MEFGSWQHLVTLMVIGLVGVVAIYLGRRGNDWVRGGLAFLCLVVYPVNQLSYGTLDYPLVWDNILPFHLCDVVAVVAGFALLTRHQVLSEFTYLWGLTGTLQGLVTPNMPHEVGHPIFWSFFLQHGVVVVAAVYLPLVLQWRPTRWTLLRMILWGEAYFVFALAVNFKLGTNFGFLREKPAGGSLLDHFGEWPWYLLGIQAFAIVAFLILLAPFWVRRASGRPEDQTKIS